STTGRRTRSPRRRGRGRVPAAELAPGRRPALLSRMHDLLRLTLVELCDALRSRRASPVELMRAVLDRIDATNPDLNAVCVQRDPGACLADARAAEARIARGDARPLDGIPLGVKELEDVAGMITCEGSMLFKDRVATRDSVQVERLRAAGAIVVGKTNAP